MNTIFPYHSLKSALHSSAQLTAMRYTMTDQELGIFVRNHSESGFKYLLEKRKPFLDSVVKKGKAFCFRIKEALTPIGEEENLVDEDFAGFTERTMRQIKEGDSEDIAQAVKEIRAKNFHRAEFGCNAETFWLMAGGLILSTLLFNFSFTKAYNANKEVDLLIANQEAVENLVNEMLANREAVFYKESLLMVFKLPRWQFRI